MYEPGIQRREDTGPLATSYFAYFLALKKLERHVGLVPDDPAVVRHRRDVEQLPHLPSRPPTSLTER
jgi:hypothetical protein